MKRLFYFLTFIVFSPFPRVTCYDCKHRDGVEANLEDEGCETYWVCRHFVGVSLVKCPDGGQVDFRDNQCKADGEVWCQSQHQQLEEGRRNAQQTQQVISRHSPRGRESTADNFYYSDSGHGNVGRRRYDDNNDDNDDDDDFYRDLDQWTYVCESEWGHEPNLDDPHCQSFWRCEHFKGLLVQCKHGLLYDYRTKACRPHRYVGCQEQRHDHVSSHPEHRVEVKRNPDGSTTLIHHYYYENKK